MSIYIFYSIWVKQLSNPSDFKKFFLLVASLLTLLNNGTYQFFYYPEAGIMWLGILFVCIALKELQTDNNGQLVKIFLYLAISICCYQSVVLFYIPTMILLLGLKCKSHKKFLIELLKNLLVVASVFVLGYILLQLTKNYNSITPYKSAYININLEHFLKNIENILLFNDNFPNFYLIIFNTFLLSLMCILPKSNFYLGKRKSIITIFIAIILTIFSIITLVSITDYYFADRIQFAFVTTYGLWAIFIICYVKINEESIIKYIVLSLFILILIIHIQNAIEITLYHNYVRKKDEELGTNIKILIEQYEQNTKIHIDKIEFCYDDSIMEFDKDIRRTWECTRRIFAADWALDNALKYYINCDLIVEQNENIYEIYFDKKNWDEFSKEQIKFKDNIMYYCVY